MTAEKFKEIQAKLTEERCVPFRRFFAAFRLARGQCQVYLPPPLRPMHQQQALAQKQNTSKRCSILCATLRSTVAQTKVSCMDKYSHRCQVLASVPNENSAMIKHSLYRGVTRSLDVTTTTAEHDAFSHTTCCGADGAIPWSACCANTSGSGMKRWPPSASF